MIRDDFGRAHKIKLPARRIVSLAPVATENLFAIGAGPQIVGRTTVCDYPAAVAKLPKVGDFMTPIYEAIRALRPDVIVVDSGTINPQVMDAVQARAGGVPVFAQRSASFEDVVRHIVQLGELTGRQAQAKQIAQEMRRKANEAARLVRGKPSVRTFVEVSRSPLYAAGPFSFVDDVLRRAGGVNVVRGTVPYPLYPKEDLLVAQIDRYVVTYGSDMNRARNAPFPSPLDKLAVVRNGGVRYVPGDLLFRSTPRLADGLLLLARLLHESDGTAAARN